MIIAKFGGSSVGNAERIRNVMGIIQALQSSGERLGLVVSAFGGMTDRLIKVSVLASNGDSTYQVELKRLIDDHKKAVYELINPAQLHEVIEQLDAMIAELSDVAHGIFLLRELTKRTLDFVMSFGERLSAFIITHGLQRQGIAAAYLDARRVVKTDGQFGSARVDFVKTYALIAAHFQAQEMLQVITGFIGSTEQDETTTLGRGGSDYTASIFGAALNVREIQIWTDVDGVLTANPKIVPNAFSLPQLSYEEAMELSHFGAKVIYPPTMQPALDKNIPIRILNSFNPTFPGTLIGKVTSSEPPFSAHVVKGISSIDGVALLRIQGSGMIGVAGIANRLFGALARQKINIILITQASSEHSICLAVQPDEAMAARDTIELEFELEIRARRIDPVTIETDHAIIAIVGEGMRRTPGIAGRMFQALGKNGINIAAIAQGSSELNISVAIPHADEPKALRVLHEAFFLSDYKTVNLFVMGVGLIGATLLRQLQEHAAYLLKEQALNIRVIGLANSRQMLFDENGLDLGNWRELLNRQRVANSDSPAMDHPARFVVEMKRLNLQNSVFVDCTASEDVIRHYETALTASISIVTPNKKANTTDYEKYRTLKRLAAKHSVKYLYETTVGAALPIIGTLNDLKNSGDCILKIEAILSGTMSFILNSFHSNRRFSDIVAEAKALGYTEPDPRDDLNGLDVARKLLILARELNRSIELSDITVENIVPENCRRAPSIPAFMAELEKADDHFNNLRQQAEAAGKVLRYIAVIDDTGYRVGLQPVGPGHPFFDLSGSDNIIALTTQRYRERPLVVKGPGAGAEVTAAGVFSDIVRIAHYLGG